MLEIAGDPSHEDYASTRRWLGRGFDSDRFDVATTNQALLSSYPPTVDPGQLGGLRPK